MTLFHPTPKDRQEASDRFFRLSHPISSSMFLISTLAFCLENRKLFQWASQLGHPLWLHSESPLTPCTASQLQSPLSTAAPKT